MAFVNWNDNGLSNGFRVFETAGMFGRSAAQSPHKACQVQRERT